MTAAPSSQGQTYQGYPFLNPIVTDAQSIDAETAKRWTNLPRKQINCQRKLSLDNPVIYIDIPDSDPSNRNVNNSIYETSVTNQNEAVVDEYPRIYVDIPHNESVVNLGRNVINRNRNDEGRNESQTPRPIYEREESNATFVEETIFYDPYKDRRIELGSNSGQPTPTRSTTPGVASGSSDNTRLPPQSGNSSSSSSVTLGQAPPYIHNFSSLQDRYPQSPIPVSEFPEPPPAYTEINRPSTPPEVVVPPRTEVIVPPRTEVIVPPRTEVTVPPRTEVIVPVRPASLPNTDRKLINCHNCGHRVHTLVVREIGPMSHLLAFCFFLFCMVGVVLVYCFDCFKYKSHYCPNCNHRVGYEIPLLCTDTVVTKGR